MRYAFERGGPWRQRQAEGSREPKHGLEEEQVCVGSNQNVSTVEGGRREALVFS